ncbi:MAG: hypothetical protein ACLSVD_09475 [Eggerthellaceae bacterium]
MPIVSQAIACREKAYGARLFYRAQAALADEAGEFYAALATMRMTRLAARLQPPPAQGARPAVRRDDPHGRRVPGGRAVGRLSGEAP